MGRRDGHLWMNTKVHANPDGRWQAKAGNRRRIRHLRRARDNFGGRVDVVIVSGEPGVSYGTAQPWIADGARAGSWWEVTDLEDDTGHFEVLLRQG